MPVLTQEPKRGGIAPPPRWPDPFGGGDGNDDSGSSFPVSRGYMAVWILLTAVTMLFAGLSSAYIVLRGVPEWQNITVPSMVWVNTLILIASSVAIEFARSAVNRQRGGGSTVTSPSSSVKQWLVIAGLLGLAFLVGQIVVWRQLAHVGVYLATNLHSSFFYVLTGAHGLHLAGGLVGFLVVLRKAFAGRLTATSHEALKVWALYWHFMDGIWLYLFLLLLLA